SASYLIADSEAQAFRQRVVKLADEYSPLGIDLHLTGPWPAYSFTDLDVSSTRISAS
ncbi:MAG: gas vesicle protein GvpFL, partial [Verrucomicrobia bacterium]